MLFITQCDVRCRKIEVILQHSGFPVHFLIFLGQLVSFLLWNNTYLEITGFQEDLNVKNYRIFLVFKAFCIAEQTA